MANVLEQQFRNLNNWTKNMTSFPVFDNVYSNGVNTLTYQGGGGYERLYIPIIVQKNLDYTFEFSFCSPSGFEIGDYGNDAAFAFVRTSAPADTGGALSYTNLARSDDWNSVASSTPKKYSVHFNSGNYTTLYVALDFGYILDGTTATFIFSDFSLKDGENGFVSKYGYSGDVEKFVAPYAGDYKIELWGAQGGSYSSYRGGYGGYSVGRVHLNEGEILYVAVGGSGASTGTKGTTASGGFNGGGMGRNAGILYCGAGGGATHIAKIPGLLSELENNIDDVVMVAGGGAGCFYYRGFSGQSYGNSGGGYHGGYSYDQSMAGTQISGYAFGKANIDGAGFDTSTNFAGGGGGFRGGHSKWGEIGAGGGSGYIGYVDITEAHMVGWNVPESAENTTRTQSTTNYSDVPTPEYAKVGNGYVIITLCATELFKSEGAAVFSFGEIKRLTSVSSSTISWSENSPQGTSVIISASVSGGEYISCENGREIPGIAIGDDLTGSTLEIKVEMTTDDPSVTPSLSDLVVAIHDAGDDRVLILTMDAGNATSIRNAVGDVTVSYGGGTLQGSGGAVEPFNMSFTPVGLDPRNNPHDAEHIDLEVDAISKLLRIQYLSGNKFEHIEVGAQATGSLTAIDDI